MSSGMTRAVIPAGAAVSAGEVLVELILSRYVGTSHFAGCVYDCPTSRTTDTTVMIGKLIALAILLLVVFYILYRQYQHCKDGTGGLLSQLCHVFRAIGLDVI